MNISIKICDLCDTCVYGNEYEMVDDDMICSMCLDEQKDKEEDEISDRRMGDIQPIPR